MPKWKSFPKRVSSRKNLKLYSFAQATQVCQATGAYAYVAFFLEITSRDWQSFTHSKLHEKSRTI